MFLHSRYQRNDRRMYSFGTVHCTLYVYVQAIRDRSRVTPRLALGVELECVVGEGVGVLT